MLYICIAHVGMARSWPVSETGLSLRVGSLTLHLVLSCVRRLMVIRLVVKAFVRSGFVMSCGGMYVCMYVVELLASLCAYVCK